MAKKMTMADIASLSGVGKSTVSRYFNGGYVKDETRAKIQKIIEEHGGEIWAESKLRAGTTIFFTLNKVIDQSKEK